VPTLGQHLVNQILPSKYSVDKQLTKATLNDGLVRLAREHPDQYPDIVTKLKRLGDEISTLEGVSVGLDDIEPDARRDELLAPHIRAYKDAKTDEAREKAMFAGQDAMLQLTKQNKGTMGEMVRSGGRGNAGQLMRMVAAPVLVRDSHEKTIPWMITHSFSEGLTPAEAWVAGVEARKNAVLSNISVTEPGDLAKILINNSNDKLITTLDCGTKNGLLMKPDDPNIIDRYLTDGRLVTPQLATELAKKNEDVVARSPMTCEAHAGICQKCQGLDAYGQHMPIGTNVGVRAAQSCSEVLTQFSLNAKHGGRIAATGSDKKMLEGIKGVRQLLEVPQSFMHRAVLAEHDGEIRGISEAPQGGHYVHVGELQHYVPPEQKLIVQPGQSVYAGDVLSDGVPSPADVVALKGLGEGRRYLVDALHDVYKRSGADIDKRHLETIAKSVLNWVRIVDPGPNDAFINGDVVNYNRFKSELAKTAKTLPLEQAHGETLANDVLHYTAGTTITPPIVDALQRRGFKTVSVADGGPRAEPEVRPASRVPLLGNDWLARLGHRYLKGTLMEGAHKGDVADLHGTNPIGPYAAGTTFGTGEEGRY
jgi:DNA-directed RNA polymerase subunit beta'